MFGLIDRYEALSRFGDPLEKLNQLIHWKIFESLLEKVMENGCNSAVSRKPFPLVMMFKILVIQALYNLSDGQMEYQLKDRLSFMGFLEVRLSDTTPDEKTIWAFREPLKNAGVLEKLFKRFDIYLTRHGFSAK
jgi:transposase, IS5 family